jgi:hypothetical protein
MHDNFGKWLGGRNMRTIAITVLAAVTLAGPPLSVAGNNPTDRCGKPNSYIPRPHTNHHVYGAPIQSPIVGHAKTFHHKHAPKQQSSSAGEPPADPILRPQR